MQRIMKLTLLLVLGIVFTLSANVRAQDQMVTLKVSGSTFPKVIAELKRQTNLDFFYSMNEIDITRPISLDVKDERVDDVLHQILGDAFSWEYQNNMVVIKPVYAKDDDNKKKSMTLKGFVYDEKKQPLPGVTVKVVGVPLGTATDMNGWFQFTLPLQNGKLEFSFIGFKSQQVDFTEKTDTLKIYLKEEATEMEEVIVTGYQNIKSHEMVGATQRVKAEDLPIAGNTSIENILQGRLAGVQITNLSGMVGQRQKTRVRGTSTILGNQEPIWVVDGIIQEDPLPFSATEFDQYGGISEDNFDQIRNFVGNAISWLNPFDIDEITVLKDASATAIYGVRAANGVIVITTKRGEKGRMAVSYSMNMGTSSKVTYDKLELMNSKERIAVSKEIFDRGLLASSMIPAVGFTEILNKYYNREISYEEYNRLYAFYETCNTDWFDLLYRNPFQHSHSLSFSGGGDKMTYNTSLSYSSNKGTARGNEQETFTASVNVNADISEKIRLGVRVSGSRSETTNYHGVDPYSYAFSTSRAIPAFDEEGNYFFYTDQSNRAYNILNELQYSGAGNVQESFNTSVNFNWDFTSNLKFQSVFGFGTSHTRGESWADERTNYIAKKRGYDYGAFLPVDNEYKTSQIPVGGELNTDETTNMNYTWSNRLSYSKIFGDKHSVSLMIGQEVRSNRYKGFTETHYGYLPFRGKTFAELPRTITTANGQVLANGLLAEADRSKQIKDKETNTLSFMATASYSYDSRYVLSLTVRSDASNAFGEDERQKFNPVWSLGARWNVVNEEWFQRQNIVSNLAIRFSFGYQGNLADGYGPYLIAQIPRGGVDNLTGKPTLEVKSLPCPDLRWEKKRTINVGADFGLFKNKVSVGMNYYYDNTQDLIVIKQLPKEYGGLQMPMNGGSMTNSGFDMNFSLTPIRTKDWIWNVGFNIAKNFNEIKETTIQNQTWRRAVQGTTNKAGYPISGFWAFRYVGVDPNTGSPLYDVDYPAGADPVADPTVYMEYMGEKDPYINSGFNTSIKWRDLSVSMGFTIMLGGKTFLAPVFSSNMYNGAPLEYNNLPKILVDRWTPENTSSKIPGLPSLGENTTMTLPGTTTTTSRYEMYNYSAGRVASTSMLKCNNINLSYNFPTEVTKRLRCKGVSLGASVSNPFRIKSKDFKGVDPEVAMGNQPITRSYSFNLSVSF